MFNCPPAERFRFRAVGVTFAVNACIARLARPHARPEIVRDATFTEGPGSLLLTVQITLMVALRRFFLYFLVVLVCRGRVWLGAGFNVAIWWGLYAHGGDCPVVIGLVGLAFAAASPYVLLRAGLLGFIAFHLVEQVLIDMPVTTDFSAWSTWVGTPSLLLVTGLAAYGFWAACRHRVIGVGRVQD